MADQNPPQDPLIPGGNRDILPINIEDEMKRSYIDYAMSVIVGARCRTFAMASSPSTGAFSSA